MQVTFSVVPPGGGEQDFSFKLDIDAMPETGDYITSVNDSGGCSYFIVRRRWFYLHVDKQVDKNVFRQHEIIVEVEVAEGNSPSEDHKQTCKMYASRGKVPQRFQSSTY